MKKGMKYVLVVLVGPFVIAMLLEILLGVVFYFKDYNIEAMHVRDYPYLYYLFEDEEATNTHGFKTSYPIEKAEGVYRIILVGGSVARGKQPDQSIAAFLEKELKEKFRTDKIQVINAGISAFVVQQEFLLIQMILQQYNPDMIIGLDGYNDLMTFKFNRMWNSDFPLPPHNWKDFRVIKDNKFKHKPYSRFALPFKNLNRLKDFMIRQNFEADYDWSSIPDTLTNELQATYWNIINDSYDFCKAKKISYISFLQPVRFYSRFQLGQALAPDEKALALIYHKIEEEVIAKSYAFSLASLFNTQLSTFKDDCHVNTAGNKLIALAIANVLEDPLQSALSDSLPTNRYFEKGLTNSSK